MFVSVALIKLQITPSYLNAATALMEINLELVDGPRPIVKKKQDFQNLYPNLSFV